MTELTSVLTKCMKSMIPLWDSTYARALLRQVFSRMTLIRSHTCPRGQSSVRHHPLVATMDTASMNVYTTYTFYRDWRVVWDVLAIMLPATIRATLAIYSAPADVA